MPPGRRHLPRASTPSVPDTPSQNAPPLPNTNRDPIWSLCPWPVELTVNGFSFVVEALPALDWLEFLLTTSPDIPALAEHLIPGLDDAFYDAETEVFDLESMYELVLDVIATVGARPWWQVMRLTSVAAMGWHILGPKMLQAGANPSTVSLSAWLDSLVVTIFENMDPKHATMFALQLEAVPIEIMSENEDRFSAMETDQASFLAMAGD